MQTKKASETANGEEGETRATYDDDEARRRSISSRARKIRRRVSLVASADASRRWRDASALTSAALANLGVLRFKAADPSSRARGGSASFFHRAWTYAENNPELGPSHPHTAWARGWFDIAGGYDAAASDAGRASASMLDAVFENAWGRFNVRSALATPRSRTALDSQWNPVPRRVRDRLGRARGRDLRGGGHRRSRRGERRVRAVRGGQRRDAAESTRARRARVVRVVRVVRVARRRGILGDGFRGISGISGISGPDPKWIRETVRRASRASRDDRRVVRFVRFARRVRVAPKPKQTPVRLRRAGAVQTDGTRRIVVASVLERRGRGARRSARRPGRRPRARFDRGRRRERGGREALGEDILCRESRRGEKAFDGVRGGGATRGDVRRERVELPVRRLGVGAAVRRRGREDPGRDFGGVGRGCRAVPDGPRRTHRFEPVGRTRPERRPERRPEVRRRKSS